MHLLDDSAVLFIGLVAIINPLAVAPIFLALTAGKNRQQRNRIAFVGAVAVAIILIVSLLIGNLLLDAFGIDIGAVQVAGGLIILTMGLAMAQGQDVIHEPPEDDDSGSVAVVPLALPITAGPGAISAAIIWASSHDNAGGLTAGIVAILFVTLVIFATFRAAPWIASRLGPDGMSIATRISGLILAAIAVNIIAEGLVTLLPGLS